MTQNQTHSPATMKLSERTKANTKEMVDRYKAYIAKGYSKSSGRAHLAVEIKRVRIEAEAVYTNALIKYLNIARYARDKYGILERYTNPREDRIKLLQDTATLLKNPLTTGHYVLFKAIIDSLYNYRSMHLKTTAEKEAKEIVDFIIAQELQRDNLICHCATGEIKERKP